MNPDEGLIPHLPLGDWAETGIDWLKENIAWAFDAFAWLMEFLVGNFTEALLFLPALLLIPLMALLAWVVRSWKMAVGTLVMMLIVLAMDQWVAMLQTMALVIVATLFAVIIAVPLGILAAMNSSVSAIVKPIMDFMQTMPAFVYLIPAVTFFSIGLVPGMFSTIIFALPPGVRMTELGIRQVDKETVEAGESFGATRGQILRGIQLPLAVPTIMAGVNQVIMLALSMAVIAGMAGTDGSGKLVVQAISTLDLPLGIEAGLGVVALAIFLDRVTAALGNPGEYKASLVALLKRRRASAAA